MAAIRSWPITIDIRGPLYDEHINIALDNGLTAYDATYLELAIRLELPLATLDAKLGAAAKRAGVKLLGLPK